MYIVYPFISTVYPLKKVGCGWQCFVLESTTEYYKNFSVSRLLVHTGNKIGLLAL